MWFVGNVDSGFVVKSARGLTIDGIQYPRNIFTKWSKEELASLNILPYREVNIDSKYQWQGELTRAIVAGEVVGTYAGIDRDVDSLKASMLEQINSKVSALQGSIDWFWTRASKGGKAVPSDVATYATSIYTAQVSKEAEVSALTSIDDIKAYENFPVVMTTKVKHTSEEGVETFGPETVTNDSEVSKVNNFGWPTDPTVEVDPSFVSVVAK
jgi:hypothetical protein